MTLPTFTLDSKYTQEEGTILLSGLQALVRLPLDQARADRRAGMTTGTFISGYRGSPVGGLDFLLAQNEPLLREFNIHFEPGVNEDLAATAVFGSQVANLFPNPKYDGVLGMWYGKGPGVDRTGDAFRHANYTGVSSTGGVLAVAGDDPMCKSSTIPSHSEIALYDANMPVLYPGNVQEVIEYGRYGFELSRYCGQWSGFKFVTNVADAFSSAELHPITEINRPAFEFDGKPWALHPNVNLLAPHSVNMEREMHEGRLEAAKLFAYANGLNRITISSNDDRIGLLMTGKTYYDTREALFSLGLDDNALRRYGIRLIKIGMLSPLEPRIVKEFADGLEEVFVIEEKRGFLELLVRDVLYNEPNRPKIVGKKDENDRFLVKGHSILEPDEIATLLIQRLSAYVPEGMFAERLAIINAPAKALTLNVNAAQRTPYFCSGCPHNRSTVVPDGSLAAAGIGCHTLAILMPDRTPLSMTQMGGEGAQWVGIAPFTNTKHLFQNIGDGTLFHSGYMSIRQAVAANVNLTYKILYNGAVAMTGGQHADGEMPIPELTHALKAEGVVRTIVVSSNVAQYGDADFAPGVELMERDRLNEAQELLRDVEGVTVLVYDQPCATELRRDRKRGNVEDPPERIFINEAVCEGCGDCGEKSNCLSVFPVETEFGRKTQIHQASCNKDYTCVEGNCPAFMRVRQKGEGRRMKKEPRPNSAFDFLPSAFPEPEKLPPKEANIYMMGIGGTGVVTTTQILATAALVDGKHVNSLDQTGLSQKGGPVVSHLRVMDETRDLSALIGVGSADAYLVFDVLTATQEKNLKVAHPERTTAIVSSSKIPTGGMVKDKAVHFPEGDFLKRQIESVTQAESNVYMDAIALSERFFGTHMQANLIVIGTAYQAGLLPITPVALDYAIELNGVKVADNQMAFRLGRLLVCDPAAVEKVQDLDTPVTATDHAPISPQAARLIESVGGSVELKRILGFRVDELIAYQDIGYAMRYVEAVSEVVRSERDFGRNELSETVARYLFKLMAYKDEYEVARLQLKPDVQEALKAQFGSDHQIEYLLQPPILKSFGMKKKIAFGAWFGSGFRLLTKMKRLRGTKFDIFGYDEVRTVERQLIDEYQQLISELTAELTPSNYDQSVTLAALPDMIRGYDEVKLGNVASYRAAVARLRSEQVAATLSGD